MIVLGVSIGDGAGIGCIVDDVGDEEREHHGEYHHEEEKAQIGNQHVHNLPQSNGNDDQIEETNGEEDQPYNKKNTHRDEEEGQVPCIVVL